MRTSSLLAASLVLGIVAVTTWGAMRIAQCVPPAIFGVVGEIDPIDADSRRAP